MSTQRLLAVFPPSKVSALKVGCNAVSDQENSFIVHLQGDNLTVYRNRCAHQGGKFLPDLEDANLAACTRHGWKFDGKTGIYTNPPQNPVKPCFKQEELPSILNAAGALEVYEVIDAQETPASDQVRFVDGKLLNGQSKKPLQPDEFTVTYYGHACVVIKAGDFKIATDPWLVGDAFLGGWYPLHKPPENWKEELSTVDLIYISHRHPDHYSPNTLRHIADMNPDIPVFVGNLNKGSVIDRFSPMKEVRKLDIGKWHTLKPLLRIAILKDGALQDLDTSLLIDYKGYTVFNYVDCGDPNAGSLGKFDVVLGDFAGGASGYPMCMNMSAYTEEFITKKKKVMNTSYLSKTIGILKETSPDVFIPFAGYFTEARPSDGRIRRLNSKNSVQDVVKRVSDTFGGKVAVHVPIPGNVYDVINRSPMVSYPTEEHCAKHSPSDINEHLKVYEEVSQLPMFTGRKGLNRTHVFEQYFKWAGFRDYDLVLEIVECSEDLVPCERSFFVDFRSGLRFPDDATNAKTWEKISVRKSAFRYAIFHGLGWDAFFIGFSTQIEREPDVYHLEFWNHMSNLLPYEPPRFTHAEFQLRHIQSERFFLVIVALLCVSLCFVLGGHTFIISPNYEYVNESLENDL